MCDTDEPVPARTVAGWQLARCTRCGFLYAPQLRDTTATELDLPNDYQPVWRARHRQILNVLVHRLPPGETVVDVGAGFGELGRLIALQDRFTYLGFEPSQSVAGAAARRGVELRPTIFDADSVKRETVGAVVLDNVLEHVADPAGLVAVAANAVRPGGLVVVIVPNRYDIRQLHPTWRRSNHWIPPEHVNYFTPRSLNRMLERFGLRPRPFGISALSRADWKYVPRAAAEMLRVFPFGLNIVAEKSVPAG